jgi:hypothetical protein
MRAAMLAVAFVFASMTGAGAGVDPEQCPSESSVRSAASQIDVKEIIPLRSGSGHQFLMLVLHTGQGLVVSQNEQGCFDTMLAMPKEAVAEVLTLSQAS